MNKEYKLSQRHSKHGILKKLYVQNPWGLSMSPGESSHRLGNGESEVERRKRRVTERERRGESKCKRVRQAGREDRGESKKDMKETESGEGTGRVNKGKLEERDDMIGLEELKRYMNSGREKQMFVFANSFPLSFQDWTLTL